MTNASPEKPKKMGRPATGKDPMVGFRLSPERVAEIEEYAEKHGISKSDAFRLLLKIGLEKSQKP